MKIIANGKLLETSAKTVANLLVELELLPTQVAVEHNGTVLFRHEYSQAILKVEDRVEIVRIVAGG